jgi:putative ATP-dependent endonuclease of the OLD family
MYLEHVEVSGFRGINRLSISLQQTTALIGENAWGKTSLLRALWCLLGQGTVPYQFETADFHQTGDCRTPVSRHLHILLTFCEYRPDMCHHSARLARLGEVWCPGKDGLHRIHYRAAAELTELGAVTSEHGFLDAQGRALPLSDPERLIHLLMLMNPVLRLRDARSTRYGGDDFTEQWESQLERVSQHLLNDENSCIDEPTLQQGMGAIRSLMDHYLSHVPPIRTKPRNVREIVSKPTSLRGLGALQELLREGHGQAVELAMASLGGALLAARGDREIEVGSRPILILEDPESRLHPTMLALAWGLLEQLPGQKILTTNSGDLLTSIPLGQIRRLVRKPDETLAFSLHDELMSAEELRRIAFHVRINRPMSLFARCWLLVEGETEIWLLSELANICGYSLRGEGVRIIEFAQCGVIPLVKAARDLGIEWHLLADGDQAGIKYADTVRSQLKGERESDRLTLLPAKDIEHFLYHHGFEAVYRKEAALTDRQMLTPGKVIDRALSRRSKPGLALSVVEAAEQGGVGKMPTLLRQMFSKVIALARRQN